MLLNGAVQTDGLDDLVTQERTRERERERERQRERERKLQEIERYFRL